MGTDVWGKCVCVGLVIFWGYAHTMREVQTRHSLAFPITGNKASKQLHTQLISASCSSALWFGDDLLSVIGMFTVTHLVSCLLQ